MIQVVSVRDIYRSSIDASFKNPQQRRLLRFGLTDGTCEAVAIEFTPIPFTTEDIAPGTKVVDTFLVLFLILVVKWHILCPFCVQSLSLPDYLGIVWDF